VTVELIKRGELMDDLVIRMGANADSVNKCKFIKTAFINSVMHNLDQFHKKETGESLWTDKEFKNVRRKTSEAISVSDIISEHNFNGKIDLIINKINSY